MRRRERWSFAQHLVRSSTALEKRRETRREESRKSRVHSIIEAIVIIEERQRERRLRHCTEEDIDIDRDGRVEGIKCLSAFTSLSHRL